MKKQSAITVYVCLIGCLIPVALTGARAGAVSRDEGELHQLFVDDVHPLISKYCFDCHGEEKQEAKLQLSGYSSVEAVAGNLELWEIILDRLNKRDMPPEEAKQQPSDDDRRVIIDWLQSLRRHEARKTAGDPGLVLARRLSNVEYDYTMRDLTGVDIRPTREFPIDPANEAGFDNSGESLVMSPGLLKRYLAAARHVADHIVLKPRGFTFAPHPVVTVTDRDKYCVHRIVDFYLRQPTDYADYFLAAWRYLHRDELEKPEATLTDLADESEISAKYLQTIWNTVTEPLETHGPLKELQALWRALPQPREVSQATMRSECVALREFVLAERQRFAPQPDEGSDSIAGPVIGGLSAGSQPITLMMNRRLAESRLRPADDLGATGSIEKFCRVFPDAFFVSERGRVYVKKTNQNKGRLLSAGFHLMVGYFRDDAPLVDLILDESKQRELDVLWNELNFVTSAPLRQYRDFLFFERTEPPQLLETPEFDFARPEYGDVTSAENRNRLAALYLKKVRDMDVQETIVNTIEHYFAEISAGIEQVEAARAAAEPSHLETLLDFARRAWRQPLSDTQREFLTAFYESLRKEENLSHEHAIRDAVVRVLMSSHFCYRIDLPLSGSGIEPLAGYALASRLSYFLWSSMPDEELLACASDGYLGQPGILVDQTRRMLRDPRSRGLVVEFGANWLDFRRFEQFSGVDRDRFSTFSDELRQAMFEEPIRFFADIIGRDRSVLDFLYADHTFVNSILADHYGIPRAELPTDPELNEWVRVDNAQRYGRGGLLPMSVFMTANSHPLATSPVKRGYWLVRRVLGERIAPPPPDVPELPRNESDLGGRTMSELLSDHRNNKSCAPCHDRFDSIGLVFEGYGPIGERRVQDFGGRPIESRAIFPDGQERVGLGGLKNYLRDCRQDQFIDHLCRSLLAYALGRSLQLSDDATIEKMRDNLRNEDYRFGTLVETIVTSPQFLNKRGSDFETTQ